MNLQWWASRLGRSPPLLTCQGPQRCSEWGAPTALSHQFTNQSFPRNLIYRHEPMRRNLTRVFPNSQHFTLRAVRGSPFESKRIGRTSIGHDDMIAKIFYKTSHYLWKVRARSLRLHKNTTISEPPDYPTSLPGAYQFVPPKVSYLFVGSCLMF